MNPAWRTCPGCGGALDRNTISLTKSFACAGCGEKLRVKQAGPRVRGLTVYLLSPLLTYECGLRGLGFVIVSALALWPLGFVAKLLVNAAFPPGVVVRPNDDPEINRCPKCGTELQDRLDLDKPFACPTCGESMKLVMGRGSRFVLVGVVLWLFVGTPLASLLGYELGIRGINLALLPLAVFLGGAAVFGFASMLAGSGTHYVRVKAALPRGTLSIVSRTELKLDNWKRN